MRAEQPSNIWYINSTFAVLNLVRSRDLRAEQPLNILSISVTFSVLKLVRSRDLRAEQPLNILSINSTFAVFKYSRPEIVSKVSQPLKNSLNDVGAYVLKLSSKTMFLIVLAFIPKREHMLLTVCVLSTTAIRLKSRPSRLSEVIFLKVNVEFVAT